VNLGWDIAAPGADGDLQVTLACEGYNEQVMCKYSNKKDTNRLLLYWKATVNFSCLKNIWCLSILKLQTILEVYRLNYSKSKVM
jgi:hypothetical protein